MLVPLSLFDGCVTLLDASTFADEGTVTDKWLESDHLLLLPIQIDHVLSFDKRQRELTQIRLLPSFFLPCDE